MPTTMPVEFTDPVAFWVGFGAGYLAFWIAYYPLIWRLFGGSNARG